MKTMILLIALLVAANFASLYLASLGEPQSRWIWCSVVDALPFC